eukprot:903429-Prorocentrum_minimum.AAC.2
MAGRSDKLRTSENSPLQIIRIRRWRVLATASCAYPFESYSFIGSRYGLVGVAAAVRGRGRTHDLEELLVDEVRGVDALTPHGVVPRRHLRVQLVVLCPLFGGELYRPGRVMFRRQLQQLLAADGRLLRVPAQQQSRAIATRRDPGKDGRQGTRPRTGQLGGPASRSLEIRPSPHVICVVARTCERSEQGQLRRDATVVARFKGVRVLGQGQAPRWLTKKYGV